MMKYTGPVYRPPIEAESLLLQVTVGCAHNKCNFCTMYRGTQFRTETIEQVEKDLIEAKKIYGSVKRVFLVNGDAFVLSANRLKQIAEKIIEYFPEVDVITMYASIKNIRTKTDAELKELAALRIGELWVGVETANADALEYLNKGFTLEETRLHLDRLNKAGIPFYYGYMFGAAGSGHGSRSAEEHAELINRTKPIGLAPTTLNANEGTSLAKNVAEGKFIIANERDIFEEMKRTIELVEVETVYYGNHIINTIPFICVLPRDKEKAIEFIDKKIAQMDEEYLNSVPTRHTI